jgi:hypothetical protein
MLIMSISIAKWLNNARDVFAPHGYSVVFDAICDNVILSKDGIETRITRNELCDHNSDQVEFLNSILEKRTTS